MILQLFRNNQIYTIFGVLIYLIPFAMAHWLVPAAAVEPTDNYYPILLQGLRPLFTWSDPFGYILFLILALVVAFLANRTVNEFRLGKRQTYITAICFILCLFAFPDADKLSPVLISNVFLIFVVNNLYRAYDRKNSVLEVFNAGFLMSIAVLLYIPALWYFIFLFIAWFILRPFNGKEFVILLSGVLVPFFLLGTYMFANDRLLDWWTSDIVGHFGNLHFNFQPSLAFWIGLGWWALLLLLSLLNIQTLKNKTTIREQKFINVIFWMLFVSCFTWIGQKSLGMEYFSIAAIPLSVLLSLNLQAMNRSNMAEFVHFLLFLAALFAQYNTMIA